MIKRQANLQILSAEALKTCQFVPLQIMAAIGAALEPAHDDDALG